MNEITVRSAVKQHTEIPSNFKEKKKAIPSSTFNFGKLTTVYS